MDVGPSHAIALVLSLAYWASVCAAVWLVGKSVRNPEAAPTRRSASFAAGVALTTSTWLASRAVLLGHYHPDNSYPGSWALALACAGLAAYLVLAAVLKRFPPVQGPPAA